MLGSVVVDADKKGLFVSDKLQENVFGEG